MPSRWRKWILLMVVVGAAATVAYYLRPDPPRTPPAVQAASTEVALQLQQEGDHLRVTWDPKNPAIRQMNHATLDIVDGNHNTKLDLDAAELASGSALYWPQSDRFAIRLEFPGGSTTAAVEPAGSGPSPFQPPPAPARMRSTRRRAVAPVRNTPAVAPQNGSHHSVWSRTVGRVPLLRRIKRRHRPPMDTW